MAVKNYWITPRRIELRVTNFLGFNRVEPFYDCNTKDNSAQERVLTLMDECGVERITDPLQIKLYAMDTAVSFNEALASLFLVIGPKIKQSYNPKR